MVDMLAPFLSNYSGVRWSAPNDATVEGEFLLAPLSLRYSKAKRRLHLRFSEVSALETLNSTSTSPEPTLTGRGKLAEVLTVFELDAGPIRQFREVRKVTITPTPVAACAGTAQQSRVDPDHLEKSGPSGVFFIDFEALRIHGEHPEPALNLNLNMELEEFHRVYSVVHERGDEIKEVTLVLEADLFGEEIDTGEAWSAGPPEYGILRPTEAPLVFAAARPEQLKVLLERSRLLGSGPAASDRPDPDLLKRPDQPHEGYYIIARRLGWIIALLAVIALILLSSEGRTERAPRVPRHFAENAHFSMFYIVLESPPTSA